MTNSKTTKRALLTSIMALMLCFAMLTGTTFAWFTDTETSANNRIVAGNLDIDLLMYDATKAKAYVSIAEKPETNVLKIFSEDKDGVWEPGKTEIVYLAVQNLGNLALKYNIIVDITDNGLKNALEYAVADGVKYGDLASVANWAEIKANPNAQVGNMADLASNKIVAAEGGVLDEVLNNVDKETQYFALAIHMKEEAGNEYQSVDENNLKSVGINVTLVATQVEAEEDVFGPNYDAGLIPGVDYKSVEAVDGATSAENGEALLAAINATDGDTILKLSNGVYKMPSINGSKDITIVGTKETVIDNTMGSYMDGSKVAFEGVTIKWSTGKANGNGSDYAALYTPNVTYTNCTFDGPFRVGRDGATFINCKFTNLGDDYVWTYGNDCTFIGCTFESEGKALLIYKDPANKESTVIVKDCVFKATMGRTAYAIANQNCAAIEIDNTGCSVDLTVTNVTVNNIGNFSGTWRIKTNNSNGNEIVVNGTKYTTIALDGKTMTIDANRNVTVNP